MSLALARMLADPTQVDFARIKDLRAAMQAVDELKAKHKPDEPAAKKRGISAELERLMRMKAEGAVV